MSALFSVSTDYLLKVGEELPSAAPAPSQPGADREPVRQVSRQEAETYLGLVTRSSRPMALGVLLLILSPIAIILLGGLQSYKGVVSEMTAGTLGIVLLLVTVAAGVAILIHTGLPLSKYQYLEKEDIALESGLQPKLLAEKEGWKSASAPAW